MRPVFFLLFLSLLMFNHPLWACNKVAYHAAFALQQKNQLQRSQKAYLKLRKSCVKHPHLLAQVEHDLGLLYEAQGKIDLAKAAYQKAIKTYQSLSKADVALAESLNKLAEIYRRAGQYQQAEKWYRQALILRQTLLGKAHIYTAYSFNNLGLLYSKLYVL